MTMVSAAEEVEVKALLKKTREWLDVKGRWCVNEWAVVRNGITYGLSNREDLDEQDWTGYEVWDAKKQKDVSLADTKVFKACLIGALIVNNDYQDDEVVGLSIDMLAAKIHEKGWGDSTFVGADDIVATFNDKSKSKRKIIDLIDKVLKEN